MSVRIRLREVHQLSIHQWRKHWAKTTVGALLCLSLVQPVWAADQNQSAMAHDAFQQLLDDEWQFRLQQFPELATWTGSKTHNDRLTKVDTKTQQQRYEFWQEILKRADAIDSEKLPLEDQINLTIFRRQINGFISDYRFKAYMIPLTSDEGFHTSLARLPKNMPFSEAQDYENYLSRLDELQDSFQAHQQLMAEGLEIGMTLPKVVLKGRVEAFRGQIVAKPEESVYYQPFSSDAPPAGITKAQWQTWQQRAQSIIRNEVVPVYQEFARFFEEDYVAGARESTAARDLPNGEAYYQDRVAYFTTLDLTADQVHQIGLKEVARIRAEMQSIIDELGFEGSFADFLQFLRTDPQFYAKTPEELLMNAAWIAKRADAALPALFKVLPRQPYGVAPVPDELAPHYTGGRYVPAPLSSTQPGYYWVNTYDLPSRPLYVLPALSLHEAVPGHHLQNAIAAEMGEQPPFRRFDYISAFGEGWGLYSEFLGIEMGIYRTPYEHFGRLTYEMWRACRLVVDTGLHWKGWSRQRALDYLAGNTALSLHEVTTEVDRYIAWPGQALSYKMGELTIKRLRKEAEDTLGGRFDLREFHDLIVAQGSVPLPVLEQQVRRYIAEQQ